MATRQRARLSALRDPVSILRALENKHITMDATEYLTASGRVSETLRGMGIVELLVIARSIMPVLSQLAENVLIERGADHLVGDLPARSLARATTETLLQRL